MMWIGIFGRHGVSRYRSAGGALQKLIDIAR